MGFDGDAVTAADLPTNRIKAFSLIVEFNEYIETFNIRGFDGLSRAASDVMDGYKMSDDEEVKDLLALRLIKTIRYPEGMTWHLTKKARIFWPERIANDRP